MKNKLTYAQRLKSLLFFIITSRYFPNFKKPRSFNEKINHRKRYHEHKLFTVCSDKIKVRDFVRDNGFGDILINKIDELEKITPSKIHSLINGHDGIVVKANHNSGHVYLIDGSTSEEKIEVICNDLNKQLKVKYGFGHGEYWYNDIEPMILVESLIKPDDGCDLKDYKFHCFKQKDGTIKVILHIDFDRNTCHNRSYFDENLNWLSFSSFVPSIITKFDKPKNYERMLEIAKQLAQPFSYVRVDLYNVDGKIYFGEMTFAQGAGYSKFTNKHSDMWLGSHWVLDPKV